MNLKENYDNAWDYLGNLETLLSKFESLKKNLIMMEETFFANTYSEETKENFYCNYEYIQSLLFTVNEALENYIKEYDTNIYKLYDSVKRYIFLDN